MLVDLALYAFSLAYQVPKYAFLTGDFERFAIPWQLHIVLQGRFVFYFFLDHIKRRPGADPIELVFSKEEFGYWVQEFHYFLFLSVSFFIAYSIHCNMQWTAYPTIN